MSREPEPPDACTDAWVVRASATGGRMLYARTRRVDVAHPYRGVAARKVDPGDIVQRAHAVGMLLDDHVGISHSSAALVRGLPLPRALRLDPELHVSVPRPRRAPRMAGVHGYSLELASRQVGHLLVAAPSTGEALPVPLVDEPLTLLTCATQLALSDVVALADALLRRATVERRPDPMLAALDLGPDRPGMALLRRAAPLRRHGVRSRAETHLRLLIASAGLPEPAVAHQVASTERSSEGWVAEAARAWPPFGVLVEYDGDGHRTSRRQPAVDVRRFDRYADEGWQTVRATRADVYAEPGELMARLARRLQQGGWRPPRRWELRKVAAAIAQGSLLLPNPRRCHVARLSVACCEPFERLPKRQTDRRRA